MDAPISKELLLKLLEGRNHREMAELIHFLQFSDQPDAIFNKSEHRCTASLKLVDVDTTPQGFVVKYQCTSNECQGKSGHEIRIESCRKSIPVHLTNLGQSHLGRGFTVSNLRDVLVASLTGHTYKQYKTSKILYSQSYLCKDAYYRTQNYVWKAVVELWGEISDDFQDEILERDDDSSIMALDFAWAHRNQRSHAGELVVMDWETHLPIMVLTLQKQRYLLKKLIVEQNYKYGGTSKGMEGFAVGLALDQMHAKGLMAKFWARVNDDDSSTTKRFNEREFCKHIQMFLDPGHKKKNVLKTLKSILGEGKRLKKLAGRMSSFFLRCIKEACIAFPDDQEKARLHFLWLFSFWVPHYTEGPCEVDCPCHHIDADKPDDEEKSDIMIDANSNKKRASLNPSGDARVIEDLTKLHATLATDVERFVSGYSTTHLEGFNACAKAIAPKRIHYYKSWGPRTLVAAIRAHIGDDIMVELCNKLQIPITEAVEQEFGKMTKEGTTEASHKATADYKKMKSKGRQLSKGLRELEVMWTAKHGGDTYDGDAVIDYMGLSHASAEELGRGVLANVTASPTTTHPPEDYWKCDLCNRSVLKAGKTAHCAGKTHKKNADAAKTTSQAVPAPASTPTASTATAKTAPAPAPAPSQPPASATHTTAPVGATHDTIVQGVGFLLALANYNADLQQRFGGDAGARALDEEQRALADDNDAA